MNLNNDKELEKFVEQFVKKYDELFEALGSEKKDDLYKKQSTV
jgi:hypothetical protein